MAEERWLTTKEVAQIIGFAHHTLVQWRRLGGGPPYATVGRSIRYRRAEVLAWMEERGIGASRKKP